TMTCAHFVLSLICLLSIAQETCQSSSSSLYQERRLISVNVGDNVTLQCLYEDDDDASLIYWYKQPLGKQPKIISTYLKYKKEGTFHDEFLNNTRLTLNMTDNTLYLKISDVKASDSATYYCLKYSYQFKIVRVKGSMVHILGGALAFTIILILLLAFEEILHYAALNVIQVSKTGRKRNITKTECVYSTVKN
uniref:Ig-like domain-containing protein n=1 Tax=Gouania willdenowi TaxID=441366 RepID=A0A8C5HK77_GOUWI